MPSQVLTLNWSFGGIQRSAQAVIEDSGGLVYEDTVPENSFIIFNVEFDIDWLKLIYMYSDEDVVIQAYDGPNATGNLIDALTITGGIPTPWCEGMAHEKPFSVGTSPVIESLKVLRMDDGDADVLIGVVVDATP